MSENYSVTTAAQEGHHGQVSFVEAIKLYFKNYVNFSGRASKSEYWWMFLVCMSVSLASAPLYYIPYLGWFLAVFEMPILIAMMIGSISLAIRRLHDVGRSGWYYFIALVPFAGMILYIIEMCKPSDGDNQWGPGPV